MADTIGSSYFEFSAKFCNELDKTKNCVFSPLMAAEITISAKALRSVVSFGLEHFNDFPVSSDKNMPSSSSLLSHKLKSVKGMTFNRASKIYLNTGHHKLNYQKKNKIKNLFNVKIKNIDFSNSTDAAESINKAVEKKTKGKIKGVLKHNDLDIDNNVILVNGLYFKVRWYMKFDPYDTEETIFHLNNKEIVNVFLMYRKEKYNYKDSSTLDAQLVLLPLEGKEAHMLIVLPKRVTGLETVLQKLADGYDLMTEVGEMSDSIEVRVRIPRFKIESEINVVEVLQKLGVMTVFDKAMQKVLIDVTEEGTEPKPERMTGGFIPRWRRRPIEFTADRPHLIVIIYENIPIIWVTFRGRFE